MAVEQNPKFWGAQSVAVNFSGVDQDTVARLANGGYVVAFRQDKQIGFQIYNGSGEKVGGTHFVSQGPVANGFGQWEPDILAKADGSFIISWTEVVGTPNSYILRTQNFSVDGTPGAVKTVSDKVQYHGAHMADAGTGGVVAAYIDDALNPYIANLADGSTTKINNPDGSAITASGKTDIAWLGGASQFVVSYKEGFALFVEGTRAVKSISKAVETNVVALKDSDGKPNGSFAVNYVTDTNDIVVKTYSAAGNQITDGKTFTISSGAIASTGYSTSITALKDGGFAVAYKADANQKDIWVKVFDAEGNAGPALKIPVHGEQVAPSIEEMPDGRLAVSWHNRSPATNGSAIESVMVDARGSAVSLTGTAGNDIYAPSKHAGDKFDGGAGFDTLTFKESTAGVAVDLVHGTGSAGDAAGDTYTSFEKVIGTNFNDTLTGGAGHVLVGGAGDDVYYVSASDTQIDESGGGNDQVYSSVSYSLSAGIEYLFATGADAIDLYGNEGNNVIAGNEAANHLTGNGGNDSLYGNGGNDLLDGGAGNDVLDGGAGNDALAGGIGDDNLNGGSGDDNLQGNDGNDALYGADGNDALDGGAGNDVLYGGAGADNLKGGLGDDVIDGQGGADTMDGGAGNDTYYIDDVNDLVQDSGAGDVDTVVVSVNYDLNRLVGIENITGVGSAAITLTGNGLNNVFVGNDGANILYGGAGNDQLNGGGGNDRIHGGLGADLLTGGTGRDIFVFDTNPKAKRNADKITDFNVKDDSIYLENKYFKVGSKGTIKKPAALSSKMFYVGAKAHDKDDRIIYDKKKGVLYYDDDGIGSHKAVVIATLKKGLKMTYKDFFVI